MNITKDQIDQLYIFTRKHFVEHYDLQTELVDHLANAIEEQWKENPNIPFQEALQKEFKKFGVFGFMGVAEERQKALGKKYWELIWRFCKEWFKLPKIILTTAIFLGFFTILKSEAGGVFSEWFFLVYMAITFSIIIFNVRKYKSRGKRKGKSWMFEDMILRAGHAYFFFQIPLHLNIFMGRRDIENYGTTMLYICAAVFTIQVILSYIVLIVLPKNIEQFLEETYPEYKIA